MAEDASRLRHERGQRREQRSPSWSRGQGYHHITGAYALEVVRSDDDRGHPFRRSRGGALALEEVRAAPPASVPVELFEERIALPLLRWVAEIGLRAPDEAVGELAPALLDQRVQVWGPFSNEDVTQLRPPEHPHVVCRREESLCEQPAAEAEQDFPGRQEARVVDVVHVVLLERIAESRGREHVGEGARGLGNAVDVSRGRGRSISG